MKSDRKIYTYFDPIQGLGIEDTTRLLLLWKENWEAHGFEPIVLNEWIARKHSQFQEFNERIAKFPTLNKPGYDRACFLRYMAMAQVKGGIMSDYDLFCYDHDLIKTLCMPNLAPTIAISYQRHVPCFIYGRELAFDRLIDFFIKYQVSIKDVFENGKPHVSDMLCLVNDPHLAPYEKKHPPAVKNYGEEGWQEAPLVHYANTCMQRFQPRWQNIKQLRPW